MESYMLVSLDAFGLDKDAGWLHISESFRDRLGLATWLPRR
jgi:hypothetical protein